MGLNRRQALYRRLVLRFPRAAAPWRWLAWKLIDPSSPRGSHYVEPFPKWFGITDEEEEWARGLISDYEAQERS